MRQIVLDLVALLGVGLTLAGVALIYVPAALIIGGLVLVVYAVLASRPIAEGRR